MIESIVHTTLSNDSALAALLSTYGGTSAIFSDHAPEDAEKPYVVFDVTRSNSDHDSMHVFYVNVDYYERGESRANARAACERIEYVLDNTRLTHTRYDSIRVRFSSGGFIEEDDPRNIHYNTTFSARASRKKWMAQI